VTVEEPTGKWVAAAAEGVHANVGETRRIADLVLTAGAIVQGTVTNAATGEPLKGLHIGSHGPHRPRSSAMIIGCETDERGRYSLRVAPGESYIYVADSRVENFGRSGHNDANVFLRKGETKTVDFR